MFIGMDDTDSTKGMCTTYLCKLVMESLKDSCEIRGFPRLIRLNPNIPYKTRGNGALSFEAYGDKEKVIDALIDKLKKHHMEDRNTNPGVVVIDGDVPDVIKGFYHRCLHEHIEISEAEALIDDIGAWSYKMGNGRGLIGALASIGADLDDHTYELIAYRMPENIGSKRMVDGNSVALMDDRHFPVVFDSYDRNNDYIAIAPNSPCPVLYGIRGNDWKVLEDASSMVSSEPINMSQVFMTNQGTDAHIQEMPIGEVGEYMSVKVLGRITESPHYEHRGHLFFKMADETGDIIAAAYEPTKEFRNTISKLFIGDRIAAWGGVSRTEFGLTINLEKILVYGLVRIVENIVPSCCGKKMQSIGKGKGYRCKQCGLKISESDVATRNRGRDVKKGLYEVPIIARRHLAKPLSRL